MKTIKIVRGSYGYRADKNSPVKLIDKNSEPITVSDEEAARLINLKVAKEVTEAEVKPETGHLDAGQFADYSYNELKKLAKDMGLSASGSKEELIERITAAEVEIPTDDESEDESNDSEGEDSNDEKPPVLEPADPE